MELGAAMKTKLKVGWLGRGGVYVESLVSIIIYATITVRRERTYNTNTAIIINSSNAKHSINCVNEFFIMLPIGNLSIQDIHH